MYYNVIHVIVFLPCEISLTSVTLINMQKRGGLFWFGFVFKIYFFERAGLVLQSERENPNRLHAQGWSLTRAQSQDPETMT